MPPTAIEVVEIRPVGYANILNDPKAGELFAAYSQECAIAEIGETNPQTQLYEAMETSGLMRTFGAYAGGVLVGFATVLVYVLPHYGQRVAAIESLFVAKDKRSIVGWNLMQYIEAHARLAGCKAVLYSAPAGGRLEQLLSSLRNYRRTNTVFTRSLA